VRIAIDARKLRDYGIGTYVRNLVGQLARMGGNDTYVLICRPEDVDFVRALGPQFEAHVEGAGNYSLREQITVPLSLIRAHVDLLHAPHYVVSPLTRCRTVVTIHDCIHLRFPQYLPNRAAGLYAKVVMTWAARHARRVLTVSQASKDDILHYLGVPDSKVDVIPNALDERRARPRALSPAIALRALCGQHQAAQEPRSAHRGLRVDAQTRHRGSEAPDHRRRDLEVSEPPPNRAPPPTAPARSLPRVRAR
jgi:glycosyltransferase involved in cell wall biosynthesis